MTDGNIKRQKIFDIYSGNLKFLEDNNVLHSNYSEQPTYICPICLTHFNTISDLNNPLTLEDAPPKSLGGKADTLTCKNCNNTCGHKIDFHLTERLRELDSANLIPGTEMKVKVKIGGETVQGTLKPRADGVLEMFHSNKNNHPEKLSNHMLNLKGNTTINAEFLKSRVIPENLEYALLKTAYVLTFKKFGYSLILEECYNQVRLQLFNPDERVYPSGFWFNPPYPKELSGVYFICNKGLEGLLVLFGVNTEHTARMFGTILPLPIRRIEETIENINKEFDKSGGSFELELYPLEQDHEKYLTDIENIKAMKEPLEKRKNIS
jgi:hypothetical protein